MLFTHSERVNERVVVVYTYFIPLQSALIHNNNNINNNDFSGATIISLCLIFLVCENENICCYFIAKVEEVERAAGMCREIGGKAGRKISSDLPACNALFIHFSSTLVTFLLSNNPQKQQRVCLYGTHKLPFYYSAQHRTSINKYVCTHEKFSF